MIIILQPAAVSSWVTLPGQRYSEQEHSLHPLRGQRKPCSIGLPLPGVQARIVDPKLLRCFVWQALRLQLLQGPGSAAGHSKVKELQNRAGQLQIRLKKLREFDPK